MSEHSFTALLVTEGPSDLDRAKLILSAWIDSKSLGWIPDSTTFIRVRGLEEQSDFTKISSIIGRYRTLFGVRSSFGAPGFGKGDARTLRQLRQLLQKLYPQELPYDAILWIRDDDGQGRAPDAVAARDDEFKDSPMALGYAHQCGEAWVLSGFEAKSPEAKTALERLRSDLRRCPVRDAHQLSHKETPQGAKAALRRLMGDDRDAMEVSLRRAVAEAISGTKPDPTGLGALLEDLDTRVAPSFFGR